MATISTSLAEYQEYLKITDDLGIGVKGAKLLGYRIAAAGIIWDTANFFAGDQTPEQLGDYISSTGIGLYGVFGGPVGLVVSLTYTFIANTYGDQMAEDLRKSIMEKRANGTLSHPKLKGGGASKKPRNMKLKNE